MATRRQPFAPSSTHGISAAMRARHSPPFTTRCKKSRTTLIGLTRFAIASGLGHYGGGAELPVALMRYSLADVLSAQASRQLSAACALPTVLDGGMHEFFFPVPREHIYRCHGASVAGAGGHPDCRDCPLPDRLSAHASVPAGDDHATTSIDRQPTARRPRPAPSRAASRLRPR